jgi:outer membrane lipoprotein-sorting protein
MSTITPSPRILASLLAVVVCAGTASAQTADDVVEKHLAAAGGRAALGKLTSRHAKGTVTVSTPGGDISGPVEVFTKAPNKTRVTMKLDLTSMGAAEMQIEQRFDGTTGYLLNSMQGDSEITGNQLQNMRNASFPNALLRYKDAGMKIELVAGEKLAGKEAIVLLLTPKSGSAVRMFLDPETYLVTRTVTTIESPEAGGSLEQTSDLSDYRTVDGVKVAFQIANSNPMQSLKLVFTSVEHNVPIDDATFAKPSK